MDNLEAGGPPREGRRQLSALGARRGQRLVPLHAIPRRWAGKPWDAGPVGIASFVCPAGHGILRAGAGRRKALKGMKKQGAGVPASCPFSFRVRLWVGWVLPYQYPPLRGVPPFLIVVTKWLVVDIKIDEALPSAVLRIDW